MFDIDVFIPTVDSNVIGVWNLDNIMFYNRSFFAFENRVLSNMFYNDFYPINQLSYSKNHLLNENFITIIESIITYFSTGDKTFMVDLPPIDSNISQWSISIDSDNMKIEYSSFATNPFDSYKEIVYIYNLDEYEVNNEYDLCVEALNDFKGLVERYSIQGYKHFLKNLANRLKAENSDLDYAKNTYKPFEQAYTENRGNILNSTWEKLPIFIENYNLSINEIVNDGYIHLPYSVTTVDNVSTTTIDRSLISDVIKAILLREQVRFTINE